jgi:hypothetical protein
MYQCKGNTKKKTLNNIYFSLIKNQFFSKKKSIYLSKIVTNFELNDKSFQKQLLPPGPKAKTNAQQAYTCKAMHWLENPIN